MFPASIWPSDEFLCSVTILEVSCVSHLGVFIVVESWLEGYLFFFPKILIFQFFYIYMPFGTLAFIFILFS